MRSVRIRSAAVVAAGLTTIAVASGPVSAAEEWRVASDGTGDFETISAAIDAASDGDTIRIAPGTYVEHLEIDKDLTISGDGDRAEVIIEPPEGQEERHILDGQTGLVLIWSEGADVTLESFTLGPRFGYGIVVMGGTAQIRDILVPDTILVLEDSAVTIEGSDLHLLEFGGPNESAVSDSTLRNSAVAWDGARVTFEGNEVIDRPIVADGGASITVTGNTFRPTEDEVGVVIYDPESRGFITDNTFSGGAVGIILEYPTESLAQGNVIDGAADGIIVVESGGAVRGNTVTDSQDNGIRTIGEGMTIEGNTIDGGRTGIFAMTLFGEAHPRATDYQAGPFVSDNTITGASHFGVLVEDVPAELNGNVICAAREPLKLEGEANLVLGSNEICEPEAE